MNIKTPKELKKMRAGAKILREVQDRLKSMAIEGTSLIEMDRIAEEIILSAGAKPSFKGFGGFPSTLCTMVNQQVVHAIPTSYQLQNGDLLTVDCGVHFKGFHTDAAFSLVVGGAGANPEREKFQQSVKEALKKGCDAAKAGNKIWEIGAAIEKYIASTPYSLIMEYTGHGIGKTMHEDPHVYNYFTEKENLTMKEGMTMCIEPIVAAGNPKCQTMTDNWTVITKDGKDACQWEHCGVVTATGLKIFV
jgi:methionyl aminopeptidase